MIQQRPQSGKLTVVKSKSFIKKKKQHISQGNLGQNPLGSTRLSSNHPYQDPQFFFRMEHSPQERYEHDGAIGMEKVSKVLGEQENFNHDQQHSPQGPAMTHPHPMLAISEFTDNPTFAAPPDKFQLVKEFLRKPRQTIKQIRSPAPLI